MYVKGPPNPFLSQPLPSFRFSLFSPSLFFLSGSKNNHTGIVNAWCFPVIYWQQTFITTSSMNQHTPHYSPKVTTSSIDFQQNLPVEYFRSKSLRYPKTVKFWFLLPGFFLWSSVPISTSLSLRENLISVPVLTTRRWCYPLENTKGNYHLRIPKPFPVSNESSGDDWV